MQIDCAEVFEPLVTTPKRIKILVGGRGSTKSTFVADYVNASVYAGELWCCAREYQNSIEESVHRLLIDEQARLGLQGFSSDKTHIYHTSGGRNFYRGLQGHSIDTIKSMLTGVDGVWIEEGNNLSDITLTTLTASLRLSASDVEKVNLGESVKMPEVWITLNRGASTDPIAQRWLKRADKDLMTKGFYEDDLILAVQANYTDIPQSWFKASGLDIERKDDEEKLSKAKYNHIWHGHYSDSVKDAIIEPEWFDACIDAHTKLGFKAAGQDVLTHDPSDSGDPRALAHLKGSVFIEVAENADDDVNTALDWATDYAIQNIVDLFIWDGDGIGLGLRRDVQNAFKGKHTGFQMFNGNATSYRPDAIYEVLKDELRGGQKVRTNKDAFANAIAQCYWLLARRMENTYRAVVKGTYINPDELISFNPDIEKLDYLRSELCGVPQKMNGIRGKFQLVAKKDRKGASPNMADCCAMAMAGQFIELKKDKATTFTPIKPYSAFQ